MMKNIPRHVNIINLLGVVRQAGGPAALVITEIRRSTVTSVTISSEVP